MSVKLSFKVFKAGKQGRRKDNSTILEFYGNFVNHVSNILSFEAQVLMNFERKAKRGQEHLSHLMRKYFVFQEEKCNTFKMSGKVSRYKIHRFFSTHTILKCVLRKSMPICHAG